MHLSQVDVDVQVSQNSGHFSHLEIELLKKFPLSHKPKKQKPLFDNLNDAFAHDKQLELS